MEQKIQIMSKGLAGPHHIKIGGHTIANVVDYELRPEHGVHYFTIKVIAHDFQLESVDDDERGQTSESKKPE